MPPTPLVHWALVGCFVLLVILAITGAVFVTRTVLRQRRRPRPPDHHRKPDLDEGSDRDH